MNRKNQEHMQTKQASHPSVEAANHDGVKINGLQQVIDMLRYADPAFRESLLRRLTQRDPNLASQLRKFIR